jgi:hypothetical protein
MNVDISLNAFTKSRQRDIANVKVPQNVLERYIRIINPTRNSNAPPVLGGQSVDLGFDERRKICLSLRNSLRRCLKIDNVLGTGFVHGLVVEQQAVPQQ